MGEKINNIVTFIENANWKLSAWDRRVRNKPDNTNLQKDYYKIIEDFCLEKGIYNQAFLIADKAMGSYNILQGNNFGVNKLFDQNEIPFIKYPLPLYQQTPDSKNDQIKRAVIDLLFEMKRENQSIYDSTDISRDSFLKVSLGEIVQYVSCWRWLMRYAQINGINHAISEKLEISDIALKSKNSEIQKFWEIQNFKESTKTYEYIWLNTIVQLDSEKQYFGYPNIKFGEILDFWETEIVSKFDDIKDIDIIKEFELHKVDSEKNGDALLNYLNSKKRNNKINKDNVILFSINMLLKEIRKKIEKTHSNDFSVLNYISVLHDISNFPIIPYFYQTVLRGNDYFFEHFVIPVGFTDSFSYKTENRKNIENHTAIYALFSIEPTLWGNRLEIMNSLQTFFRFISIPIIDACFYGNIYKTNIEAESLDSYIDTINHETSKIVESLKGNMFLNIDELSYIEIKKNIQTEKWSLTLDNKHIIASDFRILPDFNRYYFLLEYIDMWFNNLSTLKNNYLNHSLLESIIDKSIYLYIYAIDKDFRGFATNTSNSVESFNQGVLTYFNSIKEITTLEYNIEETQQVLSSNYLKLLYAALSNTFKHSDKAQKIIIKIDENNDKLTYTIESHLKASITENYIKRIKERISMKKKQGTSMQLMKFSTKLKGKLLLFDLNKNNDCFITCFEVPLTK